MRLTINLSTADKIKKFANDVIKIESDVYFVKNERFYNAKSVISVMVLLDMSKDVVVQLMSFDENEIEKFKSIMEEYK